VSATADIRLLIVDDHPLVRDGLRGIFAAEDGFDVVGEAQDGVEAIAGACELKPDVVLMDLRTPAMGRGDRPPSRDRAHGACTRPDHVRRRPRRAAGN